jgi:hypothetical protein
MEKILRTENLDKQSTGKLDVTQNNPPLTLIQFCISTQPMLFDHAVLSPELMMWS